MPASKKRPKAKQKQQAQRREDAQKRETFAEGKRMATAMVARRIDLMDWIAALTNLGTERASENVTAIVLNETTVPRVTDRLKFAAMNGAMPGLTEKYIDPCVALVTDYLTALSLLDDAMAAFDTDEEADTIRALVSAGPLPVPDFMAAPEQLGTDRWTGGLAMSSALLATTSFLLDEREVTVTEVMDRIYKKAGVDEDLGTDAALLFGATATDIALHRKWPAARVRKRRVNTFGSGANGDGLSLFPWHDGHGLLALTSWPIAEGLVVEHGGSRWNREHMSRCVVHALKVSRFFTGDYNGLATLPDN